ncbi:MAG: RidA family protein [Hyphomicrobiales bacterium]
MTIKRYGVDEIRGSGQQALPFAKATEADGWLYVSGQTPMVDGEIIDGGIVAQADQAIRNMIEILETAGYTTADIVRIGVWLDDPRDFWSFNKVFSKYFGDNPPARACVQSSMVVDCKVEVDCIAYRKTS